MEIDVAEESATASAPLFAPPLARPSTLTVSQKLLFNNFIRAAKSAEMAGDLATAVRLYSSALGVDGSNAQIPRKLAGLERRMQAMAEVDTRSADDIENLTASVASMHVAPTSPDAGRGFVCAPSAAAPLAPAADGVDSPDSPPIAAPRRRLVPLEESRCESNSTAAAALVVSSHVCARAHSDERSSSEDESLEHVRVSSLKEAGSVPATYMQFQVSPGDEFAVLPGGFRVPVHTHTRIYAHQREAVAWMWGLHPRGQAACGRRLCASGGILADDMGLGKTVMGVVFIAGLMHADAAATALVVAPVSVMNVWSEEFKKWAPEIRVRVFHGTNPARDPGVAAITRKGGVLITSYGMVTSNPDLLGADATAVAEYWRSGGDEAADEEGIAATPRKTPGRRARHPRQPHGLPPDAVVSWDIAVLDEGHKIKNPSTKVSTTLTRLPRLLRGRTRKDCVQIAKAIRLVPADYRLLLTGTPIQNNLDELWALYDYVCKGQLLGSRREFNRDFANVITESRDRLASAAARLAGQRANQRLSALVQPYMLRREKAVLLAAQRAAEGVHSATGLVAPHPAQNEYRTDSTAAIPVMGQKKELVLWTTLTSDQIELYRAFLSTDAVEAVLNRSKSPLAAIGVLRNITSHPLLLGESFRTAMRQIRSVSVLDDSEAVDASASEPDRAFVSTAQAWSAATLPDADTLLALSGKLQVLQRLTRELVRVGDKILIFSQSLRMLDIMEKCLRTQHHEGAVMRIDGSLDVDERRRVVRAFNEDATVKICLLTTGVGAHGLTLTAANRVIVYDPSWNPAVDSQAVDRAYRVGQTRDVVTYRLVSCGTVEEAMYRLQVFKAGMTSTVMAAAAAQDTSMEARRLLTQQDLKQIFVLGDVRSSVTKAMIEELGEASSVSSAAIAAHLRDVGNYVGPSCAGISHHDVVLNLSRADRIRLTAPEAEQMRAPRASTAAPPRTSSKRAPTAETSTVPMTPARILLSVIDNSDSDTGSSPTRHVHEPSSQDMLVSPVVDPPAVVDLTSTMAADAATTASPNAAPVIWERADVEEGAHVMHANPASVECLPSSPSAQAMQGSPETVSTPVAVACDTTSPSSYSRPVLPPSGASMQCSDLEPGVPAASSPSNSSEAVPSQPCADESSTPAPPVDAEREAALQALAALLQRVEDSADAPSDALSIEVMRHTERLGWLRR